MNKLKQIAALLALISLAYLQACQEDCRPVDKLKERISEESKAKMAYTGTETLVFLEIDNGDSTELTFEPVVSFDSMLYSYSYYEAPNGDECIGYETGVETIYRKYQCQERQNWFFETAMTGINEQVLLRFDELQYTESKYNFEEFWSARTIANAASIDSTSGLYYIRKYMSLNGMNDHVTRMGFSDIGEFIYYDLTNGLICWEFKPKNYKFLLKSISKN